MQPSGSAAAAASSSIDQRWVLFGVLAACGLAPAAINGYPFYFPDSSGYIWMSGGGRSLVPGFLAWLISPVFGVWSLAMINTTATALAVTRFADVYLPRTPIALIVLAFVAASAPFYVSFLMPDIWIVVLAATFAALIRRFSAFDLMLASVACSVHGSHPLILFAAGIVLVALLGERWHIAKITGSIVAAGMLIGTTLDLVALGEVFPKRRLGPATVASKVMNDVPEALDLLCERSPEEKICRLRPHLALVPPNDASDGNYLWDEVLNRKRVGLSRPEFNALGVRLGFIVLERYPLVYLRESAADYMRFFSPNRCVGFSGFTDYPGVIERMRRLKGFDGATLARAGALTSAPLCWTVYVLNLILMALAAAGAAFVFLAGGRPAKIAMLGLLATALANDAVLVLLSGGYERYHLRALFIYGLMALLGLEQYRGRRSGRESSAPAVHR